MLLRSFIVTLAILVTGLPAVARPTVIAELGSAPLLGTSTSTAEMRARVSANGAFVNAAVRKLGLGEREYHQYVAAIDQSRVAWVTVPRHLDAMTWRSGTTVYVLKNVIIPANTHGWEVDLDADGSHIALYMPAQCGNVSIVRVPARVVAHHPHPGAIPPPIVAAAPVMPVAPVEPPPAVIPDDAPPAAAVALAKPEFPPVAAVHHAPLFLVPLLIGAAAIAGVSGPGPIATVPEGCP